MFANFAALLIVAFSMFGNPAYAKEQTFGELFGIEPTLMLGPLEDNDETVPDGTLERLGTLEIKKGEVLVCDGASSDSCHQGSHYKNGTRSWDSCHRNNVTFALNRAFSCADAGVAAGIKPSQIFVTTASEHDAIDDIYIRVYVVKRDIVPPSVKPYGSSDEAPAPPEGPPETIILSDDDGDGVPDVSDACPDTWGDGEDGCLIQTPGTSENASDSLKEDCLKLRFLVGGKLIGNPGQAGPTGSVKVMIPVSCRAYLYGEGSLGYDMIDQDFYTQEDAKCQHSDNPESADDHDVIASGEFGIGYAVSEIVYLEAGFLIVTSTDAMAGMYDGQALMATAGVCLNVGRFHHTQICLKVALGMVAYPTGGGTTDSVAVAGPMLSVYHEARSEEERAIVAAERAERRELRAAKKAERLAKQAH